MTYLAELGPDLAFGDVCRADFLYDAHVRSDARAMGTDQTSAKFAERYGSNQPITYFLPGINIKDDENYVLAHGTQSDAVVLSDDCLIATVLGRDEGGPTRRRILFAPLVDATEDEVDVLEEQSFGRFPLRADEHHAQHHIVDLRRCFSIDARDVHAILEAGGFRQRALDDGTRANLAIRWSAYTVRRGPFVAEDSLEKFAELLVERGTDEQDALDVATKLVNVVGAAWGYEGRGVETAGNAALEGITPEDVVAQLLEELEALQTAASQASEALRSL